MSTDPAQNPQAGTIGAGGVPIANTLTPSVGAARPPSQASAQLTSVVSLWSQSIPQHDLSQDRLLLAAPRMIVGNSLVPSLGGIPLLSKLGQGGMGAVYFGIHPRLEKAVAVKVLPFQFADNQAGMVERFYREAQLAAKIESAHLVSVKDVNEDSGLFYLVMEFVHGQSAGAYLRSIRQMGRAGLEEALALDIAIAAGEGLAAAHARGVIHRDIKPDNIMIPKAEKEDRLIFTAGKLADLGLARMDDAGVSLTGSQSAIGTPGYMAPEQALDAKKAGKPADVYSMGATLFSLLTGQPPFTGNSPMEVILKTMQGQPTALNTLRADVTPVTTELISRCLNREPSSRYVDGSSLLQAMKLCRTALGEPETTQRRVLEELTLLQKAAEVGAPVAPPSAAVVTHATTLSGASAQQAVQAAVAPSTVAAIQEKAQAPAHSAIRWLGVVAVLMIIGLVAVVLLLRGGTGSAPAGVTYVTSNTFSGNLYFSDAATVAKEYEKAKGEPLKDDEVLQALEKATALVKSGKYAEGIPLLEAASKKLPAPALFSNLGVLYSVTQKTELARKSYEKALDANPQYQPANLNLGLLNQSEGRLQDAAESFAKAPDLSEAMTQAGAVKKELAAEVRSREAEPNDDIFHATPIALEKPVAGNVISEKDGDYFTFTLPPKYRDLIKVRVENKSTTLAPNFRVYGPDRAQKFDKGQETAGADVEEKYIGLAGAQYYVQVYSSWRGPSGNYTLAIIPTKSYDSNEPNDDILSATAAEIDKPAAGSVLDEKDWDYFKFAAAPASGVVVIRVEPQGTTLSPAVWVYDGEKSRIADRSQDTPGANLQHEVKLKAGQPFYVCVGATWHGPNGAYLLKVSAK